MLCQLGWIYDYNVVHTPSIASPSCSTPGVVFQDLPEETNIFLLQKQKKALEEVLIETGWNELYKFPLKTFV